VSLHLLQHPGGHTLLPLVLPLLLKDLQRCQKVPTLLLTRLYHQLHLSFLLLLCRPVPVLLLLALGRHH
jgi:hypothetical protein